MAENLSTIIGKDSVFTGDMEVKGTLRIDGRDQRQESSAMRRYRSARLVKSRRILTPRW